MLSIFLLFHCSSLEAQVVKTPNKFGSNHDKTTEMSTKDIAQKNSPDGISLLKLSDGDCYTNNDEIKVCFNGTLEDSRCPPNIQCVWAGNAKLDLELTLSDGSVNAFNLNTNHRFRRDTTIGNTYFLLEGLSGKAKTPKVAKLLIVNLDQLDSNAQIIGFNDKSGCSYGFQIKMEKDTIVSNDYKIRDLISKKVDSPIDIYLKLGSKDRKCRNNDGLIKYHVNRIFLSNYRG